MGAAARIAAAAFVDDPLFVHTVPDLTARTSLLPLVFGGIARECLRDGSVDLVERDGAPVGVALWLDRADSPVRWRDIVDPTNLKIATIAGVRAGLALMAAQNALVALHRQVIDGPQRYLATLAVLPTHQGRGVASELLDRGLAIADERELPVYLETNLERNVDIYRRKGFIPVRRVEEHGFITWPMLRPVGG
ncbi:GNAT family N-acetyltransferase [Luteococcus sp. Sow4_B9]|uniref:GNAT family N-acetyltransferase n=1 Tax=Luteococcus sp. Sow4_B9 TaxID=3438792 RepID=UPI003F9D5BAC